MNDVPWGSGWTNGSARVSFLLFLAILLLGGAGRQYPVAAAICQSAAIVLIGLRFAGTNATLSNSPLPRSAYALIGLLALFLVIQLVPLPPEIWLAFPGREMARHLLDAASLPAGWHSASLDPALTIDAALELLPGVALLILGCSASPKLRDWLQEAVVGAALLATALGALQRLGIHFDAIIPFSNGHADSAGIFVNRNHHASLLLIATPLTAHWAMTTSRFVFTDQKLRVALGWALVAVLQFSIVTTTSRAGLLLVMPALAAVWVIMNYGRDNVRRGLIMLALIGVAAALALQTASVRTVLDRFGVAEHARPAVWANSMEAAKAFAPLGSGLGTFPRIYPHAEPLEHVSIEFINNAHNEFVELWLEGGFASLAVLGVLAGIVGVTLRHRFRASPDGETRSRLIAGSTALALLVLHSVVDYPLRMMTIMAAAGLLLALVLRREPDASPAATFVSPRFGRIAAATLIALPLLTIIWGSALSSRAMLAYQPDLAVRYNPWSGDALADAGYQALHADRVAQAQVYAERALAQSPLNARAYGLLVDLSELQGQPDRAAAILTQAQKLGWREPHIQFALAMRASERADDRTAVRSSDALLRTSNYVDDIFPFLQKLVPFQSANDALVVALAKRPLWRERFLTSLGEMPEQNVPMHRRILEGLRQRGAGPDASEIDALLNYLIQKGHFAEASQTGRAFGRQSADTALLSGTSLASLSSSQPQSIDPFGWRSGDALGVSLVAEAGKSLNILAAKATSGRVASRLIVASPGTVQLRGRIRERSPGSWQWFRWTLRCRPGGAILLPDTQQGAGEDAHFTVTFDIPAQGCPAQDLELNLTSSQAVDVDLTGLEISARRTP